MFRFGACTPIIFILTFVFGSVPKTFLHAGSFTLFCFHSFHSTKQQGLVMSFMMYLQAVASNVDQALALKTRTSMIQHAAALNPLLRALTTSARARFIVWWLSCNRDEYHKQQSPVITFQPESIIGVISHKLKSVENKGIKIHIMRTVKKGQSGK